MQGAPQEVSQQKVPEVVCPELHFKAIFGALLGCLHDASIIDEHVYILKLYRQAVELLFEVEDSAVDDLITAARGVMEGANNPVVHLDVKLTVDAGQGQNWAEAH